jgi:hypothetical protein
MPGGGRDRDRGYAPHCADLAKLFLSDFDLTEAERKDETERLAQQIQDAVESHLEGLEHRRKA